MMRSVRKFPLTLPGVAMLVLGVLAGTAVLAQSKDSKPMTGDRRTGE